MTLRIARFVNLVLAGLLAGNEFGSWVAVHRSLWTMPTPEHIRAEQALTRRFKSIMPFWMSSVVTSCLPVLALTRNHDPSAFRFTLAGMLCFIGMIASTFAGTCRSTTGRSSYLQRRRRASNGDSSGNVGIGCTRSASS